MHTILKTCQDCGLLYHTEQAHYRSGYSREIRIDDVIPARICAYPHAPVERYELRVTPSRITPLLGMRRQFAAALDAHDVDVRQEGMHIVIRVPKPDGVETEPVTFASAWRLAKLPATGLLLGMDEPGAQLYVTLNNTKPHAMVIGASGSGKSTLMQTMALSALRNGNTIALFDTYKGLAPLSGWPKLVWRGGIFSNASDCAAGLDCLVKRMEHGQDERLYVFIDELPDLIAQSPESRTHVMRLAQSGRHAGIHLILGAQHPLGSELGATTLRNVTVKLVGKVTDKGAAANATGLQNTGAERLHGGGDFLLVTPRGTTRFQAATAEADLSPPPYPPRDARVPVRETTIALAQQSYGQGGRPLESVDSWVVHSAMAYAEDHGKAPSLNEVRRISMAHGGEGYGRDKQKRVLEILKEGVSA